MVCLPFKAKSICTKKRALTLIAAINLTTFVSVVHFLWTFGPIYATDDNGNEVLINGCSGQHPDALKRFIALKLIPWIEFTLAFLIPTVILFTCNVIIIYKLIQRRANRGKLGTQSDKENDSMTTLLLSISIYYLISTIPYYVIKLFWPIEPFEGALDTVTKANKNLILISAITLSNTTFVTNFLIYCLSGSVFRGYCRSAFARCLCCRRRSNDGSTT